MKITLAYPWTDADGTRHEPDTTLDLEPDTARRLVRGGKARPADDEAGDAGDKRPRTTTRRRGGSDSTEV